MTEFQEQMSQLFQTLEKSKPGISKRRKYKNLKNKILSLDITNSFEAYLLIRDTERAFMKGNRAIKFVMSNFELWRSCDIDKKTLIINTFETENNGLIDLITSSKESLAKVNHYFLDELINAFECDKYLKDNYTDDSQQYQDERIPDYINQWTKPTNPKYFCFDNEIKGLDVESFGLLEEPVNEKERIKRPLGDSSNIDIKGDLTTSPTSVTKIM